jgi:predicted nucleic acid-binding protein
VVVLDTNVISELVRPQPSQAVIDCLDAYESSELVVTAVTAAEPGRWRTAVGRAAPT